MAMEKSNEIFKRIEKKYILSQEAYKVFRKKIDAHMKVDEYGLSTICNVYYDTEQSELIRRSLEKPVYKEKLRIRSYGVPGELDRTYVEIKKKYDGIVYKRRIELPMYETRNYVNHGIRPTKQSQIQKEIDYFLTFYKPVPKRYIAYDRIAMYGLEDASIRITFDFKVREREYDLDLTKGDYGREILPKGQVLMEIKVAGAYPIWLCSALSAFSIYPTSFSKYGMAYQQSVAAQMETITAKEGVNKICLTA